MPDRLTRLQEINAKLLSFDDIDDDERKFVLDALSKTTDPEEILNIGFILTGLDQDACDTLTTHYFTLPTPCQKVLIPLIAAVNTYYAHKFLFTALEETPDDDVANLIIFCESKSRYPSYLYIIHHLNTAKGRFRDRLIHLVRFMGIQRFEKFFIVMPDIPLEKVFREAFGNEAIEAIHALKKRRFKKKRKT